MNSFEAMLNSVKKYSSSKLDCIVIGNNLKDYLKVLLSIPIVFMLLIMFIRNLYVFFILYFLYVVVISFLFGSRKVGIGINDNMLFLEYFNKIGFAPKEMYDVYFDNIKYISVYRLMGMTYLKVSFISNDNKFVQAKLLYVRTLRKQKDSFEKMNKLLSDLQKVKDKGDF